MITDPDDPLRRVVEEDEIVASRGEDAESVIEPNGEDWSGEAKSRG